MSTCGYAFDMLSHYVAFKFSSEFSALAAVYASTDYEEDIGETGKPHNLVRMADDCFMQVHSRF